MNAYQKEMDESELEDMVNDSYGYITICGNKYYAYDILNEIDDGVLDSIRDESHSDEWYCGECDKEFEDEEEAEICCGEEQ